MCTLFLDYRQNWLNLPWDDSHIFYIFQWMISALTTAEIH